MPQLAPRGLVMRAFEVERCRVFSPGEEVLFCGREILAERGGLCAFLMQRLCPVLAGMERGLALADLGVSGREPFFDCRGFDCAARFACRELDAAELSRARSGFLSASSSPPEKRAPPAQSTEKPGSPAVASEDENDAGLKSPVATRPHAVCCGAGWPATQHNGPGKTFDAVIKNTDRDEERTGRLSFSDLAPPAAETEKTSPGRDDAGSAPRPFLEQLPRALAERLLERCERRMLAGGEVVLEQGQAGEAVYFVLKGEVVVERKLTTGETVQLARLGPGEVFGEMALMSAEPCNATVRTAVKTLLAVLDGTELDRVMGEVPQLHRWFSHLFAARMRATNVRLEEQLTRGMNGRLSMIGLLDLMQTLLMARKSGVLTLRREGETGVIRLRDGQMRSVFAGEMSEEEAFRALCRWTDGTFTFREGEVSGLPANIRRDTMHILMDAARAQDEAAAGKPG